MQEHFRDFRTLRFDVEQRMNGRVVMKSRVSVTHDGNVRTEVGDDISVIVNSAEMQVLTLMHSARIAMPSPLDKPATKDDALAWLDDIRDFQGEAKVLPRTRRIIAVSGRMAGSWRRPAVTSCSGPLTRACRSR